MSHIYTKNKKNELNAKLGVDLLVFLVYSI